MEGVTPVNQRNKRRPIFRKQLVLPVEHGSWAWLLVPFLVGTAVARRWNLTVTMVLVGGLAAFLMRQPATIWLRARQGRARRADGPVAAAWAAGLGLIALLCLGSLLVLGYTDLLWLLVPLIVIFLVYLVAAYSRRARIRTTSMELAGAMALAAMAPVAMVAATGHIDSRAWVLWILMALQNGLGALYVRLRIADTHGRHAKRWPVFVGHALSAAAVFLAAALSAIPWPAALPFLLFLLRAGWVTPKSRPIAQIRRFGFMEVGVEIISGLVIIVAYSIR